ncbi:MAG: ABC transporter ATP-binding protein [Gemmatimonadales bacterium]|nr:MAG: ABC transporter ATP-binding protein [Gemmatimonadales bacterium]
MNHLRSLLPYYRPYLRGVIAGLVLVVLSNVFTIAGPFLLKLAIDSITVSLSPDVMLTYALLIVGAAILSGITRYGMRQLLNSISRRIETDLRNDLFGHLLRLSPEFYDRWRTGDLMSRATNDVLAVRQVAGPAIMYLVNTAAVSAFALVLMIWISPTLTAIAMIPMVLMPIAVVWFGSRIHKRFEKIQEQFSELNNFAQENLSGIRIVKAYAREDDQVRRFGALSAEYMKRNLDLARIWGAFFPALRFLGGLGAVIVLWLGGREVIAGQITIGDFIAFGFYLTLLMWPMIAVGWVTNLFQRGAASMGRINALLATEPAIDDAAESDDGPITGAIEFRNVWFRYPETERWVLEDVSFVIEPGETVAIVGATASGKSTIVRLMGRLYDVTRGEVVVDGVDVRKRRLESLRSAIATVPQEPFLFSDTLRENLVLDDRGLDERLSIAIDVAQMRATLDEIPDGLDTLLGERGINLSGGQKQRATMARALHRDSPVLILDDSLSAVDTVTEEAILKGLRKFMVGRTSIIVSHRVSAVAGADKILVLDQGRIVEMGKHAELLAGGGVYAQLLERQLLTEELQAG